MNFSNNKAQKSIKLDINLTPLIDVTLQLVIFFMLTTTFLSQTGIDVKLPQAKTTAAQAQEEITVFVTKEGRILIGQEEVDEGHLFNRLNALIKEGQNKLVIVKADREIILNKAVKVMDIAKTAGAERLCIATERDF